MAVHIVDDDEAIRTSVSRLLITEGFNVRTHASAADFIRDFPEEACGCLVTDVRMPEMSGMDLLGHVKDRGLDLNVILLTGHADVPLAVHATSGRRRRVGKALSRRHADRNRAQRHVAMLRRAVATRARPGADR